MLKDELKRRRIKAGLTQAELADMIGVHVMTVSRWELGVSKIPASLTFAFKVMEKYNSPLQAE